ncbi:metal ABC transporter permease [Schleiferia thermophila]|jgi:manganese/zinc/iron transport system permease protein|uniref:metal ABC transporter permease n=1 Tax=Schleiferia thermophila TaxID=884107 RepID=UPI0004E794CA|nr:metal ABC transporter permease [Schleiferia thermophila]KFD39715.1 zinc ABC transporter permease [Schleiferia thermophila str. Yellowstone]PMB38209.1 metal ABC transporter permease [Fischerella thermalis CCMEE 5319]
MISMFQEPNFLWVFAGSALLAISASRVGVFVFLQNKSLSGDVISHSLLPGMVIGYLLSGEKNFWLLFMGGFITGYFAQILTEKIIKISFLKADVAMAVVLTMFYGLGVVLLTVAEKLPYGNQAGLSAFLLGKAAALTNLDVGMYAVLTALILAFVKWSEKALITVSFDSTYAKAIGLPVGRINTLLTSLLTGAVVMGVQAVGVVLISALIILPALGSRLISASIRQMTSYAMAISLLMSAGGTVISYIYPKMPTGPIIVVVGGMLLIVLYLFRKKRMRSMNNRLSSIRS